MTATKEKSIGDLATLIIDDRSDSRGMLRSMLTELGITQIFEAANGREGLRFLDTAAETIDVILCDWNMPEMDGMALLRQLRTVDSTVPFLMITGRGDVSSVTEAKKIGVSGYILKPFSLLQLEAKLHIVIARSARLVAGK